VPVAGTGTGVKCVYPRQVIGELANNNGAMRPFVQTFVLASQSAKKYYVHNDIFRYQDDVCRHANGPTTTDAGFIGRENHIDGHVGQFDDTANGTFAILILRVSSCASHLAQPSLHIDPFCSWPTTT